MEGSSSKKQQATDAVCGGKPARPHWRRRDPADTAVYVVHPTQFRTVVQQLTGADSPPAADPVHHRHDQIGCGATAPKPHQAAAGTSADAAAQQQHGGGASGLFNRTLAQLHLECMAWANSEDD